MRPAALMLAAGVMAMVNGTVFGQSYPNKPIRIVTGTPGSGSDIVARLIAQGLSGALAQQVIVDNRPGVIAVEVAAKAPPDGYTLLIYGSVVWIEPLLRAHVSWDPIRDFSPLTLAAISPNIVVAHPSLPVKSIRELIALAKAKPGALNFAAGSTGSSTHLAAELLKMMAGINMLHIPYRGAGPALMDTIAGQVYLLFSNMASVRPHIDSGRLRALAVTSAQPSALAPNLPTVSASGLHGYESVLIIGAFAPARTPAVLINGLHKEIVQVLNRPDVKERFFASGAEVVGSSPEELGAKVKSEMQILGKLIRDVGIRPE